MRQCCSWISWVCIMKGYGWVRMTIAARRIGLNGLSRNNASWVLKRKMVLSRATTRNVWNTNATLELQSTSLTEFITTALVTITIWACKTAKVLSSWNITWQTDARVAAGTIGPVCLFCVFGVFFPVLSVPVQVIVWRDSSPKWPIMCRTLYSLIHSLTHHAYRPKSAGGQFTERLESHLFGW